MVNPEQPADGPEPTAPSQATRGDTIMMLGVGLAFIATMVAFVAYCWWHAHQGLG